MNNAINETKNTLEATNSRITEAEDRISEFEDRMVEIHPYQGGSLHPHHPEDWGSNTCMKGQGQREMQAHSQ